MLLTVLKMLTRTRKRVIRRAILPGITSGGTTKLIQETTTNKPVDNYVSGPKRCGLEEVKGQQMNISTLIMRTGGKSVDEEEEECT